MKQLAEKYKTVIMEKVSYKAWFTRYSKSMKLFTPGLFQALLARELELRDGELELLPLKYAFSQSCYCGNKVKKPLSQREHSCSNPKCVTNKSITNHLNKSKPFQQSSYDRDVFSAMLMLSVIENNLDQSAYQLQNWFEFLPMSVRLTIETRLQRLAKPVLVTGKDHPITTVIGKLPTNLTLDSLCR